MMNGSEINDEDDGSHSNGPQIFSLEIGDDEEETESLMRETSDGVMKEESPSGRQRLNAVLSRNFNFRQRQSENVAAAAAAANGNNSLFGDTQPSRLLGLLRSGIGNASTVRNLVLLATLATCSLLLVKVLDTRMEHEKLSETKPRPPHGPSLGGSNNPGHYDNDDDNYIDDFYDYNDDWMKDDDYYDDGLYAPDDERLPKSNVGVGVPSLARANMDNDAGHYLHDILKSPLASPYYATNKQNASLAPLIQQAFVDKLADTAAVYGKWQTPDWPSDLVHAKEKFKRAPLRDLPRDDFPDNAWQSDHAYVKSFLGEAKALVERVKEGIYEEYGYGIIKLTSTAAKGTITAKRLAEFGVILGDDSFEVKDDGVAYKPGTNEKLPGIAFLNEAAWEGLIRKLLHALTSNDDFYVVLAGRAPTYLGNNLWQSSVMQFNHIMEPVFDRFGVRLISRHMGTNASVAVAALGGADIYGEADIFWHVGDGRPEPDGKAILDLLHKQAILSGERMPVILSPDPAGQILQATNNQAWMGNLQPGASFCDETVLQNGKAIVPKVKACRFCRCTKEVWQAGLCDKHKSVCWVERTDKNPITKQDRNVGYQTQGYPNHQTQRLEGRKMAMLVLHALDEALDRWIQEEQTGVLPLPDEMWHVGPIYQELRESVRTAGSSSCERFMRRLNPNICKMEMHAFTEWTPQVHRESNRLKKIVKGKIADNHESLVEVYDKFDLFPPQWKVADDDVDVHMIAIASDASALPDDTNAKTIEANDLDENEFPNDDDAWLYEEDDLIGDHDYGFSGDDWHPSDDAIGSGGGGRDLRRRKFTDNRQLLTSEIAPKEWTVYNAPIGFCDGSAQSRCNRHFNNTCLLSNFNHYRAGIIGHGQSGKLSLSIPNVKEGIILARFDWQLEGGPRISNLRPDFVFEFTVNGKKTTQKRDEFAHATFEINKDLRVHALLMDEQMSQTLNETKTIDIDMEVRSPSRGTTPIVLLSHIYYA